MSDKITIGRCKACKHRGEDGFCENPKVTEQDSYAHPPIDPEDSPQTADMLVYQYSEGGKQYVGPEFGCVHWEEKAQ